MRQCFMAMAVVFGLTSVPIIASARLLENWPYERLFKEADLVVIASASSSEEARDKFNMRWGGIELIGLNTTFEVKQVLKGKVGGKKLTVLHFKFGKATGVGPTPIIDGPLFVSFRTKADGGKVDGKQVPLPEPEYLLFLKKGRDGRFEPVSGRIDPQLAVRELYPPLPRDLGGSQSD